MREPIETIMYRNSEIAIYQDDSSENPNDWDTEDAFLIYNHRDFSTVPHGMKSLEAQDIFERFADMKVTYILNGKKYWIIPVYAYIHSGVSLYLNRRAAMRYEPTGFDTSFKGFILVNKSKPEYWAIDDAFKIAKDLIITWNMYLSGDVYGYQSASGSCWGFYDRDEMINQAQEEIDYDIQKRIERKLYKLKTLIINHVPIDKRTNLLSLV